MPKVTHRLTKHPLYKLWDGMISRCYNKNNAAYKFYGGRGISVCDEWRNDFKVFFDWAISNGWKAGLSLDRFPDMNGNYGPLNCRWATSKEQARNRRDNVVISYEGKVMCMSAWAELIKVKYETVRARYNKGLSLEKVLSSGRLKRA